MITLRQERPADVKAREALLDEAFGDSRNRKTSQRLRDGRLPAEGLSFVAADGKRVIGTARLWSVACGDGSAGLAARPGGGRRRLPQARHRRRAGAPRAARGAQARPRRRRSGRRCALLQPLRLFGRDGRRADHARTVRAPSPARARTRPRRARRRQRLAARQRPPRANASRPAPHKQKRQILVDAARGNAAPPFPARAAADITQKWLEDFRNDQLACSCPHHGPRRHDRLRLHRQRHAAADRASFQLRQVPLRRHRSGGQGPASARRARHPLHPSGGHPRQLQAPADAAAHRRRRPGLLRQRVGRHLLARHHGALPRDRRALHRHRGRALDRLLLRLQARAGGALELRAARDHPRRAAQEAGRADRGLVLRRQSRHGVVVRQAGAAQRRRRPRPQVQGAEDARGMGPARQEGRRQGHPYRRARHPARQAAEAAERLRQHLVGRGLHLRRHAAVRARLGHA